MEENRQAEFVAALLQVLQDDGIAEDVDTIDVLDAMAVLGIEFQEATDENSASAAYFAELQKNL